MTSPFMVRGPVKDDRRFIAASWFESFWKGSMQSTGMTYEDYKRGQDPIIQRLLEEGEVLVLASATDPATIVGYAVFEGDVLHYCYIKSVFRRFGAAKGLLRGRCTRYSHLTKAGQRVARSLNLTYDPYTLLGHP